jgi:hypothetical protein
MHLGDLNRFKATYEGKLAKLTSDKALKQQLQQSEEASNA